MMTDRKVLTNFMMVAGAVGLCASFAAAQGTVRPCTENENGGGDRPRLCEVRSLTIPAVENLQVDARKNGGVSIEGSERSDIEIEAVVQVWSGTDADQKERMQKLRIMTDGGKVRSEGLQGDRYSVSYKIKLPVKTSVVAKAENGGIEMTNLDGQLRFNTTNGGVDLKDVAGDVKGETTNGGLDISLSGPRWIGAGLNAQTTNGGVQLELPKGYGAHLEASTVNGGLEIEPPFTTQGAIKNSVSADIGGGGPTLKLDTINGGVEVTTR
jgi:DUF4097 and DUF4098 domain-containing protein YvlB